MLHKNLSEQDFKLMTRKQVLDWVYLIVFCRSLLFWCPFCRFVCVVFFLCTHYAVQTLPLLMLFNPVSLCLKRLMSFCGFTKSVTFVGWCVLIRIKIAQLDVAWILIHSNFYHQINIISVYATNHKSELMVSCLLKMIWDEAKARKTNNYLDIVMEEFTHLIKLNFLFHTAWVWFELVLLEPDLPELILSSFLMLIVSVWFIGWSHWWKESKRNQQVFLCRSLMLLKPRTFTTAQTDTTHSRWVSQTTTFKSEITIRK